MNGRRGARNASAAHGARPGRTVHELPAAMANRLAWDAILATCDRVADYPVVRFKGRHYLVEHGNPWPAFRDYCKLLARPGNPTGDLCITSDGIVAKWADGAARRGYRRPTIMGIQEDVQPVISLPVAGAIKAAGQVRPGLPGGGPGQDDEQLRGGIRRRLPGGDQPKLHSKKGA